MNQPRTTITLKSAVLALADLGLLFGYALAISLLARLLVFSNTYFMDNVRGIALGLAQVASSLVYLPSALLLRATLHWPHPGTVTQGWADVAQYTSALNNAILWTAFVVGVLCVLAIWRSRRQPWTRSSIWAPVAGVYRRFVLTGALLLLLALAVSPWTKEARVTAACTDRLARLPVGTSIESVRSALDQAWSDPVHWPEAAMPEATSLFPLQPTPGIPDPDTPLVDVLCTDTESGERGEVWIRLGFTGRMITDLDLQRCFSEYDSGDGCGPIFGSMRWLFGRRSMISPQSHAWDTDWSYSPFWPASYRVFPALDRR